MTHFEAYLLTRLDTLSGFFVIISVISAICFIGNIFLYLDQWDEDKKSKIKPTIKYFALSMLTSGIFVVSIPSKKEMAFIYIAPAIVNNQDFQKTVKQLPELSNLGMQYLNDILKEKIADKK
jgi:hypothetical protein